MILDGDAFTCSGAWYLVTLAVSDRSVYLAGLLLVASDSHHAGCHSNVRKIGGLFPINIVLH